MSNILIPAAEENILNNNVKRQVATSVVHVTVTAAGTVVYTHTATSYSYMPSYSTIESSSTPSSNNGTNNPIINPSHQDTKPNLGAIIGGVVGGIAFIALIALVFLYKRRSKKKKNSLPQPGGYIDDTNSYYQAGIDMTSSSPAPRHLVAPLVADSYYNKPEYYEDTDPTTTTTMYPNPAYYSTTNSLTSDSLTVDGYNIPFRQVPNLASTEERHVPHLKEHKVEPPHTKD